MQLPVLHYRKVVTALKKIGFEQVSIKGSHLKMKKRTNDIDTDPVLIVIIPMHREIARGTLMSIIRRANLTREEFLDLL